MCDTEFGKSLGRGLYEFRLRHTRDELQAKTQPHLGAAEGSDPTRVLLRVFFAVYGDKIVLLLGGYDKGKDPSKRRQNTEIAEARKRLKAHQARLAAEAKAAAKGGATSTDRTREVIPTTQAEQRVPAGRSFLLWFRKRRASQAGGRRVAVKCGNTLAVCGKTHMMEHGDSQEDTMSTRTSRDTSFSSYVADKEASATPQRRAQMDAAREHAKVLYASHFGSR